MSNLIKRKENYSKWYNQIIIKSGLAETSGVRGCMIIKPYGYAIWEKMKKILDKKFKITGHKNAYFPLLIPKSYFSKEINHINGFSKECAIVTHYRFKKNLNKKKIIIDPETKLKEELIIRPTSETIIWNAYHRWIKSYRDLPILINQWSNIIRWEMRPRLFLRNSEFLWQEGHTAHASKEEAIQESKKILSIYKNFIKNFMSVPVIEGIKTSIERFYGAEETYCIESIMQDGKAIQIATSHFLGQNFSKAFNVKFTNRKGIKENVWGTSWGISTRLIGVLIMTHSDDNGLILPPKLAPIQVVIIPIYNNDDKKIFSLINKTVFSIKKNLEEKGISVKFDKKNNHSPGWKFNEYEMKGIPIRISIGKNDLERKTLEITRRDTLKKFFYPKNKIKFFIPKLLKEIQKNLYKRALKRMKNFTTIVENYKEFKNILKKKGGFLLAHWNGCSIIEKKIQKETKATIRCIPINQKKKKGICIFSGEKSLQRVFFAKSY